MTTVSDSPVALEPGRTLERGRTAVKAALIRSACELLSEVGPSAMSVRIVANRAGVNHGQVHHYFGGKQGLIDAAVHYLAQEHYNNAHRRSSSGTVTAPLTLNQDDQYMRTVVRLVMDGDIDTATRELAQGISIAKEIRELLSRRFPNSDLPVEMKARFAITMAMELGWAALEDYILIMSDVDTDEVEEVRERARYFSRYFINNFSDQSQ